MDSIQLSLDGKEVYPDIEFDCPICGKHIIVKRDKESGAYYHRPWMFHFTYEHGKTALKYVKDSIGCWLYYFISHPNVEKELIEEWKEKVPNFKPEVKTT